MKRTTLIVFALVEEDGFPTALDSRDVVETTAEELPVRRCPTSMLPPALQRLAAWIGDAR